MATTYGALPSKADLRRTLVHEEVGPTPARWLSAPLGPPLVCDRDLVPYPHYSVAGLGEDLMCHRRRAGDIYLRASGFHEEMSCQLQR